jgi:hypothetical protein
MIRNAKHFTDFSQGYPDLEQKVTKEVSEACARRKYTGKSLLDEIEPLEPSLYEACTKMRPLVDDDKVLGF